MHQRVKLSPDDLEKAVLHAVRQIKGCEHVQEAKIQREVPKAGWLANWDISTLAPLPSDPVALEKACSLIAEFRKTFELAGT